MVERLTYWNKEYGCWSYKCASGDAAKRLAAYEDSGLSPEQVQELTKAKADGRLVVLPCKIGEKVYRYCNDAINEGTIINILLNVKTGEIGLEYEMPTCYTCSRSGTLGKNLFLTREEAEKALQEGLR